MAAHRRQPAVTDHSDVNAITELAMLADDAGCPFSVVAADVPAAAAITCGGQ